MINLRRPCWDKYHRCPGWAGSGWKYNKLGKDTCQNGYITYDSDNRWYKWKFHHCNQCNIVVFPMHAAKLDPRYFFVVIKLKLKLL